VPQKVDGVLAIGRSLSSERFANGSARCQAPIMGVGQVAGTAAALCVRGNTLPRESDVTRLRAILREQGAVV
jgi:hypothetical protein